MKSASLLLIFGVLCSCARSRQNDNLFDSVPKDKLRLELISNRNEQVNIPETVDSVQVLLQFNNLTLRTRFEDVLNDESYFAKVHENTILIQLGLANKISGQTYLLKPATSIESIRIYQNYETSLRISNEGPHVDLTDWIHYVGEWKELKTENDKFKTLEYSTADQEKFPNVTTDQILEATKKHLKVDSSRWTELAKQCTGANEYPCGVSISRINLKIVLTDNKGIKTVKYIILEVPMGC